MLIVPNGHRCYGLSRCLGVSQLCNALAIPAPLRSLIISTALMGIRRAERRAYLPVEHNRNTSPVSSRRTPATARIRPHIPPTLNQNRG